MLVITHRVIATTFALTSFAAAILVGVWADNALVTILTRAILTMLICYTVGALVGGVAERVVVQHIEDYKRRHPMPGEVETSPAPMNNDSASRAGKQPRTT